MRYLIVIAAVLCALIIGYNAFYVPDASMTKLTVAADVSSLLSGEEYTPRSPTASNPSSASVSSTAGSSIPGLASNAQVKDGNVVSSAKTAASGKIDLNTATAQQLSDGLDGVGDVMAKRIVAYREKNGKFKSIEEIKNVSGIGDKTFAKLKDHLTI